MRTTLLVIGLTLLLGSSLLGAPSCPKAVTVMERVQQTYADLESFRAQLINVDADDDIARAYIWFEHPYMRVEIEASIEDQVVAMTVIYDFAAGSAFKFCARTDQWTEERLPPCAFPVSAMLGNMFGLRAGQIYTSLEETKIDGRPMWAVQAVQGPWEITFWIDRATYLVVRHSTVTGVVYIKEFISDLDIPAERFVVTAMPPVAVDLPPSLPMMPRIEAIPVQATITVGPDPEVHAFTSIQAAIDAAEPGATIVIAPGVYRERLTIEKDLRIIGAAAVQTVIDGDGEGTVISITAGNVSFSGITVTGSGSGRGVAGILAIGESEVELTAVSIVDNSNVGILLRDAVQATIVGSTIERNGHGLFLTGDVEANLYVSHVRKNQEDGIELGGNAELHLFASTIEGNVRTGITLADTARVRISASTISTNKIGLDLWDSTSAEIIASTIEQSTWGILVSDRAEVTIAGSTIQENRVFGISLSCGARGTIIDSTIQRNEWGIDLEGTAYLAITGSLIQNNSWGIGLGESAGASISGNRILGNEQVGIASFSDGEVNGTENVMTENGVDLIGNLPAGLRIPLIEATEQEVRFPDPSYPGLQHAVDALLPGGRLILGSGAHLGGATIDKDLTIVAEEGAQPVLAGGVAGLSLVGTARVEVSGLIIADGMTGVVVGSDARLQLTDSRVQHNQAAGIWLTGAGYARISCSLLRNNAHGVMLEPRSSVTLIENVIISNKGYGVQILAPPLPGMEDGLPFVGNISGRANIIPGPEEKDGNEQGAFCRPELAFLIAVDGGEYP